ncbi:MAG TPA: aminotransferase class III-fold pyridoxal phosphate-dependent enzyme, partial [Gaiellaceae bacterium]|nr:aminotransferase class III-fold pyridoxal phosphate-dependent enzyme [Gaiellaceae bacterium]
LGSRPDAVTLAKGLANGLPIGALLVADEHADAFEPGDHASTFGGNPVTCAAALAVEAEITNELLAHVRGCETLLRTALPGLRGRGLLLALDVERPAADVVTECLQLGLLVGTAGEHTLRLTPPLTITHEELEHALDLLEEVLP